MSIHTHASQQFSGLPPCTTTPYGQIHWKEWKFLWEGSPGAVRVKIGVFPAPLHFSSWTCSWPLFSVVPGRRCVVSKYWEQMDVRRDGWWMDVCYGVTWDHWAMAGSPILGGRSHLQILLFLTSLSVGTVFEPSETFRNCCWINEQTKPAQKRFGWFCFWETALRSFLCFSLPMHSLVQSQDHYSILLTSPSPVFPLLNWTFTSDKCC